MSATEQDSRNTGRRPSRMTRARDIATFILGWGLIYHQALLVKPAEVNETFLILAAGLLGYPFGAEAVSRIRNGNGTTTQGSVSSSQDSAPSSSLPSTQQLRGEQ